MLIFVHVPVFWRQICDPFNEIGGYGLDGMGFSSLREEKNIFLLHQFGSGFKDNVALCSRETRDIYFDFGFKGNVALCSKETRDIYFDSGFKGNVALCSKETRDIYFDSSFK
jgi:hypothetical protein